MFLIHQMMTSISVLFNLHTDNRHIEYPSHPLTIYLDLNFGSWEGESEIYIAGWCVASLKHHKKSYVKRTLYSMHSRENVDTTDEEVKCLEELVMTEEEIFQTTTDLSSLMDVKRKQKYEKV